MSLSTIRYAIADDHNLFREGLRLALSNYPHLELAGEANNGEELLWLVEEEHPDVVLLDLNMPVMNGLEATIALRKKYPRVHILIVSMNEEPSFMLHLIEMGAHGYLLKNAESAEIALAMRCCVENGCYFNDYVNKLMLREAMERKSIQPVFKKDVVLTPKEKDILRLVCEGLSSTQMSKVIFLSPRTIEGIRAALMEKTGTHNMAGLVMYAVKCGIAF